MGLLLIHVPLALVLIVGWFAFEYGEKRERDKRVGIQPPDRWRGTDDET